MMDREIYGLQHRPGEGVGGGGGGGEAIHNGSPTLITFTLNRFSFDLFGFFVDSIRVTAAPGPEGEADVLSQSEDNSVVTSIFTTQYQWPQLLPLIIAE